MLTLAPLNQEQREWADLECKTIDGTLLVAATEILDDTEKTGTEETAGFSITFTFDLGSDFPRTIHSLPHIISLESAVLRLTVAYADPTKLFITPTASAIGFSQKISQKSLFGYQVGDVVEMDVTPFMRKAMGRGATTFGFDFSGNSRSAADEGYVYFLNCWFPEGPSLFLKHSLGESHLP